MLITCHVFDYMREGKKTKDSHKNADKIKAIYKNANNSSS